MQTKEYISATTLSKKTGATLDTLESGTVEKLIILKNNAPMAILMSVAAFEAMEEEMEDLRLSSLAMSRLQTFTSDLAITHDTMMEKFAK